MRLGGKLMFAGILLLVVSGVFMSPTTTSTETVCTDGYYGETCEYAEVEEPNTFRSLIMVLGGFLFSTGAGGWVGTYDAERRFLA